MLMAMFKEFPIVWNSDSHHCVHASRPLDPMLNNLNTVRTLRKGSISVHMVRGVQSHSELVIWSNELIHLFATAYQTQSQLFSMFGGRYLNHKSEKLLRRNDN
jgi:hypothetical protein